MPDSLHVYLLDEAKNQHEGMTKEQIVTAIENMETTGSVGDVDAGFISKVLELNKHGKLRFWVGTMAEFNALEAKEDDTLYLYTDDPTLDEIEDALTEIQSAFDSYKTQNDSEISMINSRLDDLGFSQATVTITTMDGNPVPTVANKITKQGNRVIMEFDIKHDYPRPVGPDIGQAEDFRAFKVTVPNEYAPAYHGKYPEFLIRSYDDPDDGDLRSAAIVSADWGGANFFYIPTCTESSRRYGGLVCNVGWDIL